jgi:SRSO17 transposase
MEIKMQEYEQELNELMGRINGIYAGELGYKTAQSCIRGLLGTSARKNGRQMSEYLGETTPYKIQQFLYRGRFIADAMRDIQRIYISEKLGEKDGILVVDETGFLKQGKKSCGVKRQYSGTAGRIENCQIGVFLTYASTKGHCPIDRRLYIPQDWMEDKQRRNAAGVPETVIFKTKPQTALEMIHGAAKAKVPYKWVTGDCVYGDYRDIRMRLEDNEKCYVMSISGKEYVWRGYKQVSIANILKNLPEIGWFEASCGGGSKGGRVYDWLLIEINPGMTQGKKRSLLVRRSKSSPDELRAYVCFASVDESVQKLVEAAGSRRTVEACFKESKSEAGLDQYEVRSYDGWLNTSPLLVSRYPCLPCFPAGH